MLAALSVSTGAVNPALGQSDATSQGQVAPVFVSDRSINAPVMKIHPSAPANNPNGCLRCAADIDVAAIFR